MSAQPANCPVCQTPVAADARFCAACGNRLAEGETVRAEVPAHETTAAPVRVEQATPRWFGLAPPTVLLLVTAAAAVLGLVLLLTGSLVAGLLVLGLALLLAAAFLEAGRRKPDAQVVKTSVEVVDSLRARAGVAASSWLTRSNARREVARRRGELLRLEEERERLLRALGAAVYAGEDGTDPKARLGELDERRAALEAEVAAIVAEANERVSEERLQVQPTEVRRPDDGV